MADEQTNSALQGVATGLENLKATLSGISQGLQNLGSGIHSGGSAAMAGLGRMMPSTTMPNLGPMGLPRHGMYVQEMSFTKSLGTLTGFGTRPPHMSAHEMQGLAARDMADRIAGFGTMATIHGAGMAASSMAMAPLFNMGASMGGFGGMALGTGLSIGGGMIAAPMAFSAVASGVAELAAQTNYIRDSSYRYAFHGNQIDKQTGTGFNRQAASQIAIGIKRMSFEDQSLDSGDLQGILETGNQYDLFRGAADPDKFLQKFKDLTGTVKKMASAFHTSLGEAVKMIAELDKIGIQGSAAIANFATKADVYGMASGKTAGEMASVGIMGAEMVRGTGMSLEGGANALQSNVAGFTSLRSRGLLSEEAINQAGGIKELSQGVHGAITNSVNNPFMRVAMAGMVTPDGNLNMSAYGKLAAGGTPMSLIGQTMGALSTPADYINAFVNADKIKRQMSEQPGGMETATLGMITGMAKQLHPYVGGSLKNVMAFVAQGDQFGMSSSQWEALESKATNSQVILDDQMEKLAVSSKKQYEDVIWERGNPFGRAWKATKGALHRTLVEPVAGAYQNIAGDLEEGFNDVGKRAIRSAYSLMGERVIDRVAVSDKQYTAAVGELDTYLGKASSSASYRTDELTAFSTSTEYMQSVYQHRSAITNPAFNAVKSADEMSTMVYNKKYNELTKNEKMTIRLHAEGNGEVTKNIGEMEKKVQIDYTKRLQAAEGELTTSREDQTKSLKFYLNAEVNKSLGGTAYNLGFEATNDRNIGDTKELVETTLALKGDLSKMSDPERAALVKQNAAIRAKVGKRDSAFLKAFNNMDGDTLSGLGQRFKRLDENTTALKSVEIAEKGKAYLDSLDPGSGAEGAAIAEMKEAFSSGADIKDIDFTILRASKNEVIKKSLAGFDAKGKGKGTLADLRGSLAGQIIGNQASTDIQNDEEGQKQMAAITENVRVTAKQFKDTAIAMQGLMSQINPLITKLEAKGYIPDQTVKL